VFILVFGKQLVYLQDKLVNLRTHCVYVFQKVWMLLM